MPIALEKYELLLLHPIVLKCLKSWSVGGGGEMLVVGSMQNLPTLSKRDFELKQWQWITSDMGNVFIFNIYIYIFGGKIFKKISSF